MIRLPSVGIDTGYGSVKGYSIDPQGEHRSYMFESKVCLVSKPVRQEDRGTLKTWIVKDGDEWYQAAGGDIRDGYRISSLLFFATPEYRALTKIMIAMIAVECDATHINKLVLGLPVNQYALEKNRSALIAAFSGRHEIFHGGVKRAVEVVAVEVLPQPSGALVSYHCQLPDDIQPPEFVAVLDVGNGTSDYIQAKEMQMERKKSKALAVAMGELRNEVAAQVSQSGVLGVDSEVVHEVLCHGFTYTWGKKIMTKDLQPHLDREAAALISRLVNQIKIPDVCTLVLTGAAAHFLLPFVRNHVSEGVSIYVGEIPAFENVKGFALYGGDLSDEG